MTVAQIDREMSAKELAEWMVFYAIEPFGPAREDYRAALQCSITANIQGAKVQPSDFIKPWNYEDDRQSKLDMIDPENFSKKQEAQMAAIKALMGGRRG